MKKIFNLIKLQDHVDDIAMIIGSGFIFHGISKIDDAAAQILLGICFIAYAYLYAKRRWK
mgnify:CR=1 FL=1